MKVEFRANDKVTLVAEGETPFEVFDTLAGMQEVFGEERCGKCAAANKPGTRLRFKVRRVKDGPKKEYTYPELHCEDCRAKLIFSQMEGGGLFPVRFERNEGEYVKDANGKLIPKGANGWVKWNFEKKCEE